MDNATSNALSPQSLLLIILIAVAAWAVIELALLLRKTRRTVDELTESVGETLDQIQPIIVKLDGAIAEVQPTIAEVQPLVEKVELAIDEANVSLAKVNGILGDVSEMSETASSVTNSVKSATAAAANSVAGFVDRMSGASHGQRAAIPAPVSEDLPPTSSEDETEGVSSIGYITYGAGMVTAEKAGKGVESSGPKGQSTNDETTSRSSRANASTRHDVASVRE